MKTFKAIFIYMIVSGCIGGAVHNYHHSKCGTKAPVTNEDAFHILLWPVSIGYAITLKDEYHSKSVCK